MNFMELVTAARSCRRFDESRPLSEQDLDWLLACARLAPSARNAQEIRFITITAGPVLDKILPLTKWAGALKDWSGPEAGQRPTAFIATLIPERGGDLLCIDVGIACQTIQLAATSRQWGACMIWSFERKACSELLKLPEGYKIELLVGLGVALEKRVIADMPADGSFTYWRDADGVHHVPKRALKDLVAGRY